MNLKILIKTDYEHRFSINNPVLRVDELIAVINYNDSSIRYKKGCGKRYLDTPFLNNMDPIFTVYTDTGDRVRIELSGTFKKLPPDIVEEL